MCPLFFQNFIATNNNCTQILSPLYQLQGFSVLPLPSPSIIPRVSEECHTYSRSQIHWQVEITPTMCFLPVPGPFTDLIPLTSVPIPPENASSGILIGDVFICQMFETVYPCRTLIHQKASQVFGINTGYCCIRVNKRGVRIQRAKHLQMLQLFNQCYQTLITKIFAT
mgnify:CR=1 FL=1